MFSLAVLVTACLAGSTVVTAYVVEKPFYALEDAETLFEAFVQEYGKEYNPVEYLERLQIFKQTLVQINDQNAQQPLAVFKINHFADLKPEELQFYRGLKHTNMTGPKVKIPGSVRAPDSLDWRQKGVVAPVKDQQTCGSCFIFSAIGNIEGQYAIKHGQLKVLSEGQALDCLQCGSCGGGQMVTVMQQFAQRAGVMTEQSYPYTPAKGACHEDPSQVAVRVLGGQSIDIQDDETLKQNLAQLGPLAVALNANDLPSYTGGILQPNLCNGQGIDHAVLLIGYGEENGTKFWIVKNSWGAGWGEQGFFRILRGVSACSIGLQFTASATVA